MGSDKMALPPAAAAAFIRGWQSAAGEPLESPLAKALSEAYPDMHPERMGAYINALVRGEKPDPADFSDRVIVPFRKGQGLDL